MTEKEIIVTASRGIHARTAALLAVKARECKADIWIEHKQEKADLKDIMQVMELSIMCGERVKLYAEGENEKQELEKIIAFIENGLE